MRPFADPNDRYSYEDWMNEMGADEGLPELPPMGHPLQKLGARLGELLDEDHWAECERLLLEGWAHDEIDRKTGRHWRENSDLEVWFPYTHEELARLRETLQGIADADWRQWEELATPMSSCAGPNLARRMPCTLTAEVSRTAKRFRLHRIVRLQAIEWSGMRRLMRLEHDPSFAPPDGLRSNGCWRSRIKAGDQHRPAPLNCLEVA